VEQVDSVVIGAGVVGLAVARALAQAGREVIVVEAQTAIGQGVSSRNSEVIHAGLYYTPGSLKAQLCVRGKELLYALCASHGVDHRNCGKLVVATTEAEAAALRALQDKAAANGVPVQWLDAAQAKALEPALACTAALLSPTTGIVDSHGFMLALQGDLENAGGMVALGSAVESAVLGQGDASHVLRMADGSEIAASIVVNSASLHACALARRFEGLDVRHVPQESYAKGSYYALAGRSPFARLIYPAPADAWLGVHLTLDLGGQAKFGPDLEWLDSSPRPSITPWTRAAPMASTPRCDVTGPPCPMARCSPATAACGPRSTGPARRRRISASMARPRTACRAWSTCLALSHRG